MAQNSQVKKAAQAVFSINTFKADGTPLATSHGVFVSGQGEAITQWTPFAGASKAVVVDANGKKYEIDGIIGANDLYDVCKFRVKGSTPKATIANTTAPEKSNLWLACYGVKSQRLLHASVAKIETFSKPKEGNGIAKDYPFYILDLHAPDDIDFCPVINDNGEIVALIQKGVKGGIVNAISALYPSEFKYQAVGTQAALLAQSGIPSVLPETYKEAQLALFFAAQQRKGDAYKAVVEQFISSYPDKHDGYEARARLHLENKEFALADADMQKVIATAENKAEAHHTYSDLILRKELYFGDIPYSSWSLDKAMKEAQTAYTIDNAPIYLQQQAQILFAQKKYDDAYNIYMQLQGTILRSAENMLQAVACKQAAGASAEEIMANMDSVIAACPQPLTYQSAKYVFQRGAMYQELEQYRKAMLDYNLYEKLMVGTQLAPQFYYNRFLCEREARAFQQALEDITKAIDLNQNSTIYYCERASLQLRLRMYDEAIADANRAIIINDKTAEAYAVLGVAQCNLGKKHEGLLNLEQSRSLGYQQADALIKKYK
ncbi:MAG: hypothetical protein NC116_07090 [Clostridium sp.]|nr:hypothetical protein [Clostridium sp.]